MSDFNNSNFLDLDSIKVESLEFKEFPMRNWEKFRVYVSKDAVDQAFSHAEMNKAIEIGGLMMGDVYKDDVGPYVLVKKIIAAEDTISQKAQITFTHHTWIKLHQEIDTKYPDLKIVGWYHSHPGFGIFLSEMDLFIHKNFFQLPWQIALVVDPCSGDSGVFIWNDGKIVKSQRYFSQEFEITTTSNMTFPEIFSTLTLTGEELTKKSILLDKKISFHVKIIYLFLLTSLAANVCLYYLIFSSY